MNLTITIGWNLIPIFVTILSLLFWAAVTHEDLKSGGYMSGFGCAMSFCIGGFVTCAAWLVYVLCTR